MSNATAPVEPDAILLAWEDAKRKNPKQRNREVARALGVSEAALIASLCGQRATRLQPKWGDLLRAFEALGVVQAITRNEYAVIEKDGRYRNQQDFGPMGQVLDDGIDLRIFYRNWGIGLALQEESRTGPRRSFQFFTSAGLAVHKVFLRPESDADAFDRIVRDFAADDQSPALQVAPEPEKSSERADSEVDVAALRTAWTALRDTHDFHRVLRANNVTRTQAFRLAGLDLARPVSNDSLRAALHAVATAELPVMIFVSNAGMTQIHTGPLHRIVVMEEWLNVLDPGFSLHVREGDIAQSWVVRKPTDHGVITSLELYAADGEQVMLMVSKRPYDEEESDAWRSLLGEMRGS